MEIFASRHCESIDDDDDYVDDNYGTDGAEIKFANNICS